MTIYLQRDELLDIHLVAIEQWRGRMGIRSQDRLIAILYAPQQIMFGVELYPTLADKVAVVGFQLAKHRPFVAGNEPTAVLAMLRMLAQNQMAITEQRVGAVTSGLRQVLLSTLDRTGLARYLEVHCGMQGIALPR
ncbi:MAG: type II toxin-antitoxin system death-on-curing family toxin [Herpetosiphon sp.]